MVRFGLLHYIVRGIWLGFDVVCASVPNIVKTYIPGKTIIVQFGQPRTATTLQHFIVHSMARIKNMEMNVAPPPGSFLGKKDTWKLEANTVYKTHEMELLDRALDETDAPLLLFSTSGGSNEHYDLTLYKNLKHIAHVQNVEEVRECATAVIADYVGIFNLTQVQQEVRCLRESTECPLGFLFR